MHCSQNIFYGQAGLGKDCEIINFCKKKDSVGNKNFTNGLSQKLVIVLLIFFCVSVLQLRNGTACCLSDPNGLPVGGSIGIEKHRVDGNGSSRLLWKKRGSELDSRWSNVIEHRDIWLSKQRADIGCGLSRYYSHRFIWHHLLPCFDRWRRTTR